MSFSEKQLRDMGYVMRNGMLVKEGTPKSVVPSLSVKPDKKPPMLKTKVTREKKSIGKHFVNYGKPTGIKENKFVLDKKRRYYVFDLIPISAPRMSSSDKWKTNPNHVNPKKRKREVVVRYHDAKSRLINQANKMNFKIGRTLEIVFFLPMPDKWKKTVKENMNGMPCLATPDVDNLIKGVLDSLRKNDSDVWSVNAKKYWAYTGSILIYQ